MTRGMTTHSSMGASCELDIDAPKHVHTQAADLALGQGPFPLRKAEDGPGLWSRLDDGTVASAALLPQMLQATRARRTWL